jgi:bifunctional DNase/RNase
MASDPGVDLVPARIDRILPFRDMSAVVLEAAGKKFMIMVGQYEAFALMREIRGEKPDRPLTHDVIGYLLTGFDIEVRRVVISSLVNDVFCATLVLAQAGEPARPEVRLDIRASDSLVIAKKTGTPISVTRRVLDQVEDVTQALLRIDEHFATEGGTAESGDGDDGGGPGNGPEGTEGAEEGSGA